MALDARARAIVCCCLLAVTCILYIVSNAVPKWASAAIAEESVSVGLWSSCRTSEGITVCASLSALCSKAVAAAETKSLFKPICSKLQAAQAFMTIACIISGLSALSFAAYVLITKDSTRPALLTISKILSFVSVVAGIIGVAIGISVFLDRGDSAVILKDSKVNLNASAIVGIIAVVLNILSAIFSLMIK